MEPGEQPVAGTGAQDLLRGPQGIAAPGRMHHGEMRQVDAGGGERGRVRQVRRREPDDALPGCGQAGERGQEQLELADALLQPEDFGQRAGGPASPGQVPVEVGVAGGNRGGEGRKRLAAPDGLLLQDFFEGGSHGSCIYIQYPAVLQARLSPSYPNKANTGGTWRRSSALRAGHSASGSTASRKRTSPPDSTASGTPSRKSTRFPVNAGSRGREGGASRHDEARRGADVQVVRGRVLLPLRRPAEAHDAGVRLERAARLRRDVEDEQVGGDAVARVCARHALVVAGGAGCGEAGRRVGDQAALEVAWARPRIRGARRGRVGERVGHGHDCVPFVDVFENSTQRSERT